MFSYCLPFSYSRCSLAIAFLFFLNNILVAYLTSFPFYVVSSEFINLVSSESNEVCNREEKRTIAPEHVLKALEVLFMFLFLFVPWTPCIDNGFSFDSSHSPVLAKEPCD